MDASPGRAARRSSAARRLLVARGAGQLRLARTARSNDTREASRGLPRPTLNSTDAHHLEAQLSAWTGDGDDVAGGSAEKRAPDRRLDRHTSLSDVTLDRADHLVLEQLARLKVARSRTELPMPALGCRSRTDAPLNNATTRGGLR
jgi:hypothetical protein